MKITVAGAPTDCKRQGHFFDSSAMEDATWCVLRYNPGGRMAIKSAIPVGYSDSVRDKYGIGNVIVPHGFLRGSPGLSTIW